MGSDNLKKIPLRSCIVCNVQKNKSDLIRIVMNKEGNISIDKTGKANGRVAYICNNIECLEKAIISKKLECSFERTGRCSVCRTHSCNRRSDRGDL